MPIYEFECKKCNTIFETITFSSSKEEKVICEKCQSDEVKKLVSAIGCRVKKDSSSHSHTDCQAKSGFT